MLQFENILALTSTTPKERSSHEVYHSLHDDGCSSESFLCSATRARRSGFSITALQAIISVSIVSLMCVILHVLILFCGLHKRITHHAYSISLFESPMLHHRPKSQAFRTFFIPFLLFREENLPERVLEYYSELITDQSENLTVLQQTDWATDGVDTDFQSSLYLAQ